MRAAEPKQNADIEFIVTYLILVTVFGIIITILGRTYGPIAAFLAVLTCILTGTYMIFNNITIPLPKALTKRGKKMSPSTINIYEIIGTNCLTREQGRIIYEIITDALESNPQITLNFDKVHICTSCFFNTAIGPLYATNSPEYLNKHIKISNINKYCTTTMNAVTTNAKRYYNK